MMVPNLGETKVPYTLKMLSRVLIGPILNPDFRVTLGAIRS
jgi:hypothetical protein